MDKLLEKLCNKALFDFNRQALKDNHEITYLISKERLSGILLEAMQAQAEACAEEYRKCKINKSKNTFIYNSILNAKVVE